MAQRRETDAQLLARIGLDAIERRERARQNRNRLTALVFMAPALVLVIGVLLVPVGYNIYLSLMNWRKFKGFDQFFGLRNYLDMSASPYFFEALDNTAIWVAASLIFPILIGLALALLFRGVRFEDTFKNIVFLPRILAPTAVAVLWVYVYAPHGAVNRLAGLVFGHPVDVGWLYQDSTITPSIIFTFVWQTVGLVMVLLLLGLNAIPKDPVEAARMDGASPVQSFRYIVLPLLTPTLLMVSILCVLAGFTVFDLLWVMGAGYPGLRTLSLAIFMYFEAFQKGGWSFGSAVAVVIGLIVLSVTWLQAWLQHRIDQSMK
jgi:ABC-type sugar transport system permease subunit